MTKKKKTTKRHGTLEILDDPCCENCGLLSSCQLIWRTEDGIFWCLDCAMCGDFPEFDFTKEEVEAVRIRALHQERALLTRRLGEIDDELISLGPS